MAVANVSRNLSEVINGYDFSKIVTHAIRKNPQLTPRISFILEEYKKFIISVCETRGSRPVPSSEVDALWHSHILHTKEYREFSETLKGKGKFIEHVPTSSNISDCSSECSECNIDVSCSASCDGSSDDA